MNINNMEKEIMEISLDDIIPNRFQPRLTFDEEALNELAKSIRQHGIIQPLVLRKIGNKYEIIAGERRYKAAYIAGLSKVPAVIIDLNDNESAEVAIVENIQRKNLSPIEEAKSYKKLLDRGYLTQEELASRMGKTQGSISNKLRLLNLTEEVQDALLNNQISERHARSLLKVENEDEQIELLNRIINERLNVRDTENLINNIEPKNNYVPANSSTSDIGNVESFEDINNFFSLNEEENNGININNDDSEVLAIEDKVYPEIAQEEKLLIEDEKDTREVLQEKIKKFIEDLKMDGYKSTYDSYEFDNLYEFIVKIEK